MLPPVMVKLPPFTYTPPPLSSAVLPVMLPPVMVNVELLPILYTPPPSVALLPVIEPPNILKAPPPLVTYTPPPRPLPSVAVLPVIEPPYILKVPPLIYTPLPLSPLSWVILPVPLQSVRVKVVIAKSMTAFPSAPVILWPLRQRKILAGFQVSVSVTSWVR